VLAVLYGHAVLRYLREHGITIALGIGAVVAIGYGIARALRRRAPLSAEDRRLSQTANPPL